MCGGSIWSRHALPAFRISDIRAAVPSDLKEKTRRGQLGRPPLDRIGLSINDRRTDEQSRSRNSSSRKLRNGLSSPATRSTKSFNLVQSVTGTFLDMAK
jgi:hypothetical protein